MGCPVHGIRSTSHGHNYRSATPHSDTSTQVRSFGRMGCLQRATLHAIHLWDFPAVLDSLFRLLLCRFFHKAPLLLCISDLWQIQVYAIEVLHFSQTESVNLIIIINAAGLPIRAPFGYLADRYIGPMNCLIPWVALCGILMFCWVAVKEAAGLYAFTVFYGLASAAAMGLFAGTVPSLTKDMDKIGTRVGMILTLMSLGPLTGPSVAGALIARTDGGYLAAQLWAGISLLLGTAALIAARVLTVGWRLKAKI